MDSSRQSSSRRGESVLPGHQQAISTLHSFPVILVRSSTTETDLIVLAIATQSWPSKPMGAKFSEESLQECHVCPSFRPELGGEIALKGRVNQCDYVACTLSNYGSAFRGQVTAYLTGYCGFQKSRFSIARAVHVN